MNILGRTACFLILIIATNAQTAVLFGASGAVGCEVLKSLLVSSYFEEVILIGRKSYPKVDAIISENKERLSNVTVVTHSDLNGLDSYDGIERADACFIALGVGDVNKVTFQYWHSVEVDLIGTITRFCDKIQARSITLLSSIDADYESAKPFPVEEINADGQKPLGWVGSISIYHRVKGLEEKAVVENSKNIKHVRLFRPSTFVTQDYRYGLVDRIIFALHFFLDPIIPEIYHSVDVKLLGLAMVEDASAVLQSSSDGSNTFVANLTYKDYIRVAGEAFKEQQKANGDEL
mmetsp:Transcript_23248/g.39745  ORF Transcript_23248/g.39745 Transcript_23248/m.39745 type:complete len:291 (-) Transcript_23248:179-1051(-)